MEIIQLQEQLLENTCLQQKECRTIIPYMNDGSEVVFNVKRGREEQELCLRLTRRGDEILANGSYFVGIDWIKEGELAIQVNPKMNNGFEIDYVRMLNEALCEPENYEHLKDLITIHFDKPSPPENNSPQSADSPSSQGEADGKQNEGKQHEQTPPQQG